ncbi:MAG TPA: mechanosensitive ion channel family protein [Aquabacterium sp.]|uniref:mechanosensitive ion channel family protein n=1 Tax=Aquabacterium sp. TaxID=1872578 RepID=UPI002E3076E8|nr:mechanosensitive ion channel family protein [Aquabacterium sp.]HEX5357937.1 mechanosensitive ion channel family protein [Aquabacterium sp.]
MWLNGEPHWLTVVEVGIAFAVAGWLSFRVADALFEHAASKSPTLLLLRRATTKPANVLPPLIGLEVVLYGASDALPGMATVRQVLTVTLVFCTTWLLTRAVGALGEALITSQPTSAVDSTTARRIMTQTRVITRSVISVLSLIGVALALMTFPDIRHIGASLLASAGLAGIVAGLAARPLLGNWIAGLQIGLTQPIRLEDVVIVENEWGWIEEITGTYVVVRLWDQRRLVVPLEWWTQHPFQNWTRSSSAIIGTVFLWVDYRMPLQPLRDELLRVCRASVNWNGQVCLLQVTEAGEHAMQLRCLVSSADSPRNWDLRCEVREQLLAFVQRHHPECLPTLRAKAQTSQTVDSPVQRVA